MRKARIPPEIIKVIREQYDGTALTAARLAAELNMTKNNVCRLASRYRCTKKTKRWTPEEDDFLLRYVTLKGYDYVSKKLGRTRISVVRKAFKLGVGLQSCVASSSINLSTISAILGVDFRTVKKWVDKRLINYNLTPTKARRYRIELVEFERFLRDNQNLWDSRKMKGSLWLTEPGWMKEKRKKDLAGLEKKEPFSKQEDQLLISMAATGCLTYKEMAGRLGRSINSIKYRLMCLRRKVKSDAIRSIHR